MKTQPLDMPQGRGRRDRRRQTHRSRLWALPLLLLGLWTVSARAEDEPDAYDHGAEILTRGPIHEAFADIVSYNPDPGVTVFRAPPEPIEELPPEARPEGDAITWIPGYWAWDDERNDFLWICGTWRALPPGRRWTPGYWSAVDGGYQWISGYWADSSVPRPAYLPRPPESLEAGPNVEAPSPDHGWTPGVWVWQQDRYAWRPGYWAPRRAHWEWIPAHYVWTPRGYVFVEGYWDHDFSRRGVVYAPVYFQSSHYSRPGYSFSPTIAIGLVAMMEHLFLRPDYHHYYFGDYYDNGYRRRGYYLPYTYHSSRHGYDPVYSHRRWTHRGDEDWERRFREGYEYRRDHRSSRPPRTWDRQRTLRADAAEERDQRLRLAARLDEINGQGDRPVRIRPVPAKERLRLMELGREVRKTREQRRSLESAERRPRDGGEDLAVKPRRGRPDSSPATDQRPERASREQPPPAAEGGAGVRPPRTQSDRGPDRPRGPGKLEREEDNPGPRGAPAKPEKPSRETRGPAAKPRRQDPAPSPSQPGGRSAPPSRRSAQESPLKPGQPSGRSPDGERPSRAKRPEKPSATKPRQEGKKEGGRDGRRDAEKSGKAKKKSDSD